MSTHAVQEAADHAVGLRALLVTCKMSWDGLSRQEKTDLRRAVLRGDVLSEHNSTELVRELFSDSGVIHRDMGIAIGFHASRWAEGQPLRDIDLSHDFSGVGCTKLGDESPPTFGPGAGVWARPTTDWKTP